MKHAKKFMFAVACLVLSGAFAQVPPQQQQPMPAQGSGPLDPIPETPGKKCTSQMNTRQQQCPANTCTKVSWTGPRCTASTNPNDSCSETWTSDSTTPIIVSIGYCSGSTCHLTGEVNVQYGLALIKCESGSTGGSGGSTSGSTSGGPGVGVTDPVLETPEEPTQPGGTD